MVRGLEAQAGAARADVEGLAFPKPDSRRFGLVCQSVPETFKNVKMVAWE
jgi:hypothetical protein